MAEFDIVLFGATGFVGRLTAARLAEHAPDDLRIALAGRSEDKLREVRDKLPARAAQWSLVVADSSSDEQLRSMAERTEVVIATVGPYAKYGLPLVGACAQAGVALIGGQTAEHPGLLEPDEYDIAGAATGVVERADLLTPDLVQAWAELQAMDAPVTMVGLNFRESAATGAAFAERSGMDYPSLTDEDGILPLQLQGRAQATPTTLVLDGQGRIAAVVAGPLSRATLIGLVEDVLADEGTTGG